jgi:general secretion pathway protein M
MTTDRPFDRYLARFRWAAVAVYVAVVGLCLLVAWSAVADILSHRAAVAAAADLLAQLEGRQPAARGRAGSDADAPAGSPYLDGPTMTIAGAALQARVAGAVNRFGGNVISTQVDLQGAQSKTGFISVVASCDIEQTALQKLLYDLEAGMPFLFVDQLVVEAPASSTGTDARMRVLLGISGQWQGAK